MSGTLPAHIRSWAEFEQHFSLLAAHGIVHSIKDFYWDVRPKPRVRHDRGCACSTPRCTRPTRPRWPATRELCKEVHASPGRWLELKRAPICTAGILQCRQGRRRCQLD
ncbi:hypothetical protein LP420_38790 [Massilia sp. B-10]|nr:hypothetical protein LP420_38790 [Massilia sp. B-10]